MIAKRITYLKNKKNLTQSQLASKLGYNQSYISKIEKGSTKITSNLAENFSVLFDVPPVYFKESSDVVNDYDFEQFFNNLLLNKYEINRPCFENEKFDISISKEVEYKLLQASFYYKTNLISKGDCVTKNFLSLFTIEDFEQNSTITKYYYLYMYELNLANYNLDMCCHYCDLLLDLLTDDFQRARVMLNKSNALMRNGRLYDSFKYLEETLYFIRTSNSDIWLARAYLSQSSLFLKLNLDEEALRLLNQVENMIDPKEHPEFMAGVFHNLGAIYGRRGNYVDSLTKYESAISLKKENQGTLLTLISLILRLIESNDFKIARKKLEVAKKIKSRKQEEMILKSLEAQLDLYEEKIDLHKYKLKIVLDYFENLDSKKDLHYIYSYLADYHFSKNNFKKSATYYNKKENLNYEKN